MSGASKDQRAASAARRSRAIIALTGALIACALCGFALALLDARGDREAVALGERTLAAQRLAADLDAAAFAAERALMDVSATGAGPQAITEALSAMDGISGALAIDAAGATLAASDRELIPAAAGARAAMAGARAWSGVVERGGLASLVAARKVTPELTIVAMVDVGEALPAGSALVTASGRPIAGAPGPAAFAVGFGESRGVVGRDANGRRSLIGVAQTRTGAYALSTAPAPGLLDALAGVLFSFGLLLTAPTAAAAVAVALFTHRLSRRAEVAEAKLDNVQRHFRLAVDGARAGVWTWRPAANQIDLSTRLMNMLGAPGEHLSAQAFVALAAPEDQAGLEAALRQAAETGALEASFRITRNGQLHWIEARGVAIEEPEQPGACAMVGTALDVTPRREAELRSVALERRLKEAIEGFSGPFALYDQRKRLLLWNHSFAELFQLSPQALRPGASYDSIDVAAKSAIRRESHDPADAHSREIELRSGAWMQLVERRTVDGGLVCVGVDITALKRQEETLLAKERNLRRLISELERSEGRNKELARKAEEASRAKSAFLANMSHELRTPLNAINGFSEILANELFGPLGQPRYKEYAKDILSSGELLLDMINDILDMAKIEAGKFNLSPRPLDPGEAIDQAVRLLRRRAEDKGLQLLVDAPDLPEIEADHRTVKQMLMNLLSNAIKFTDKGAVMVRGRAASGGVKLQVIDTGEGISKEDLPRLARPFEQVDGELARKHGGTGLGLALTKTFAELHGGEFEIESELGKGTVVSIFLPTVAALPEHMARDAA